MMTRMLPVITITTSTLTVRQYNNTNNDSTSDDSNDIVQGDTYLSISKLSDRNKLVDSACNPSFMMEDGNYDDLLSGLTFVYSDL